MTCNAGAGHTSDWSYSRGTHAYKIFFSCLDPTMSNNVCWRFTKVRSCYNTPPENIARHRSPTLNAPSLILVQSYRRKNGSSKQYVSNIWFVFVLSIVTRKGRGNSACIATRGRPSHTSVLLCTWHFRCLREITLLYVLLNIFKR